MKKNQINIILFTIFLFFGCSTNNSSTENPSITIPNISTKLVISITNNSALSGGDIISDGGDPIIKKGVIWSINSQPTTVLSTKTNDGSGSGSFTSTLSLLIPNTIYHIRAYATNSIGTSYGNELIFNTNISSNNTVADVEGNIYQTVNICNQLWTKSNLNVSKYNNGDIIPQVNNQSDWSNLTTGAWCYYNNDSTKGTIYGKLYNWYAINDPRGLAPLGWHVASDLEWTTLTDCLGGLAIAGGKMKEIGNTHWSSPNASATNSSGFTGLPGGYRKSSGTFANMNDLGYWWSTTENNTPYAWHRYLNLNFGDVNRISISKKYGLSIRCIKD